MAESVTFKEAGLTEVSAGVEEKALASGADEGSPSLEGSPAPQPGTGVINEELWGDLTREYGEKGSLGAESYEKLGRLGFSKGVVDTYLYGLEQQSKAAQGEIFEAAGGRENFEALKAWSVAHVSEEEREAFNEAVRSGDKGRLLLMLKGLRAAFEGHQGRLREPALPRVKMQERESVKAFASVGQMTAAMRDPRYQRDGAYRAEVMKALEKSRVI